MQQISKRDLMEADLSVVDTKPARVSRRQQSSADARAARIYPAGADRAVLRSGRDSFVR